MNGNMRVGTIVQARMNSTRLPGKVLHRVHGQPMLQYLLESLNRCKSTGEIVVATSDKESDQPIVNFCNNYGVQYFRGSLNDVSGRFKRLLETFHFDGFLRICADSPFILPEVIEKAVEIFYTSDFDLVTNVFPRSYPTGQSVEVLKTSTFIRTYKLFNKDQHFEHVTKYFYLNHKQFEIMNFYCDNDYTDVSLTVDNAKDIVMFEKVITNMTKPHWKYTVSEIVAIYRDISL
jgi:spore coat polysaccharide biosynthesis protein SpsF (cytidylyltransferase family)|tara:strand:- start:1852 stop:2550 length:699 start_codon:yes stop_codon:yes gene_type:complete